MSAKTRNTRLVWLSAILVIVIIVSMAIHMSKEENREEYWANLDAAQFNVFWCLAMGVPAIIMLSATWFKARAVWWIAGLISVLAAYSLINISVEVKWDRRIDGAKTPEERQYWTERDGANLVFAAYVSGPVQAVIYTLFWGYVGVYLHSKRGRVTWPGCRVLLRQCRQ